MTDKQTEEIEQVKDFLQHVFIVNDNNLNREVKKEKEQEKDTLHNEILTSINDSSKKNHEQKRMLKPIFFWIVMIMYMVVILGGTASLIVVPVVCPNWYIVVPSVFASLAAIITALVKIPSIIAEYLFPKEEDDLLVKLSQNVFRHDEFLKRIANREIKRNPRK